MMIFPRQDVTGGGMMVPVPALHAVGEAEVAPIIARHAAMRRLCQELEDCANRLPDHHVVGHAARLSAELAAHLRACEAMGRAVWCRMFGIDCDHEGSPLSQRLRHYHTADTLHAEDLHEALAQIAARPPGPAQPTELIGYMLRCLFDGCRRAIDCRESALLLFGRDRMSRGAAAALAASLGAGHMPA
ncbi:MAG: hypothetical protein ACMVO5_10330 [Polymorphobacter sp.]|uniref:hypothetical protein n=1 Tax=Polymorphobacter sp. TaxID=1909290 RepID=UPI003A83FF5D